jgi:hypothetical protein
MKALDEMRNMTREDVDYHPWDRWADEIDNEINRLNDVAEQAKVLYLETLYRAVAAEQEIDALEKTLRFASGVLSTMGQFTSWHPQDVYNWLKRSALEDKDER